MPVPEADSSFPALLLPDRLALPPAFDLSFEGFGEEAFAILERLRSEPHIEQYRKEKAGIDRHIMRPFKQYRDDLAVNLVLPNRLPLETERNVFSRLLKNDFGAGGCHHHLWMSFYRLGGKRLADVQLPHSLDPDGLSVGLWIGLNAPERLKQAKAVIARDPETFAQATAPFRKGGGWSFNYYVGAGAGEQAFAVGGDLSDFFSNIRRISGIWIRRQFSREDVLHMGGGLVPAAAAATVDLWPLYLLLTGEQTHG